MNEFRRDLVERVFIILDADDDGIVDINDIKLFYNAARHPEVMQGKKSEAASLSEFLESFEEHHQLISGSTG